jgi:NTP pyrophosphatase (non-canonical NTP hydrolase)|tara:strand:+ start:154 stop:531 length:378 start_codon:yes stop_codon:yes gene_type:complete
MSENQIDKMTAKLVAFRDERDWKQFHNPKDLAAALSIEAAELQELFLWKQPGDLDLNSEKQHARIEEEVADIASFLLLFCSEMQIDLADALERKIAQNAKKYPADTVRGSAKKYNEYSEDSAEGQ